MTYLYTQHERHSQKYNISIHTSFTVLYIVCTEKGTIIAVYVVIGKPVCLFGFVTTWIAII